MAVIQAQAEAAEGDYEDDKDEQDQENKDSPGFTRVQRDHGVMTFTLGLDFVTFSAR